MTLYSCVDKKHRNGWVDVLSVMINMISCSRNIMNNYLQRNTVMPFAEAWNRIIDKKETFTESALSILRTINPIYIVKTNKGGSGVTRIPHTIIRSTKNMFKNSFDRGKMWRFKGILIKHIDKEHIHRNTSMILGRLAVR